MRRRRPLRTALPATVLSAALVLTVGGCSADEEPSPSVTTVTPTGNVIQPGRPGEANTTHTGPIEITAAPVNAADSEFMTAMIMHHAQAIEMVELTRGHLEDPQVAALAERIAAAQAPEIAAMASWLIRNDLPVPAEAQDAGVDVAALGGRVSAARRGHDHGTGAGSMEGMASEQELTSLAEARGREADVLFLQLMTRHHQGALVMAGEHGSTGIDAQAIEMSTEMHVEQTAEIDRMADLLAGLGE